MTFACSRCERFRDTNVNQEEAGLPCNVLLYRAKQHVVELPPFLPLAGRPQMLSAGPGESAVVSQPCCDGDKAPRGDPEWVQASWPCRGPGGDRPSCGGRPRRAHLGPVCSRQPPMMGVFLRERLGPPLGFSVLPLCSRWVWKEFLLGPQAPSNPTGLSSFPSCPLGLDPSVQGNARQPPGRAELAALDTTLPAAHPARP